MSLWKLKVGILTLSVIYILAGCGIAQDQGGESEVAVPEPTSISSPSVQFTPMATEIEGDYSPAVKEARTLTLEWPSKIRAGDSDVIRLTLEVDNLGNITPTAEIAGHEVKSEIVYIPDIYETHHVIASARLDIAGLQVTPNNLIEQPLLPGEYVDFYWSVTTDQIGTYRGAVWLYLRFLPLDGGEETQKPLTAQVIEIESTNLFGLGGTPARLLGSLGILVSGLLGMDDILSLLRKGYQFLRKGA